MGNCLNPQKIKSYETSSLMDGDEYKLETLSNRIDDISNLNYLCAAGVTLMFLVLLLPLCFQL